MIQNNSGKVILPVSNESLKHIIYLEAYSVAGKLIYNRWKIRKNMPFSFVFSAPINESCVGKLNKLHCLLGGHATILHY